MRRLILGAVAALAICATAAAQESYPTKPIMLVTPYPAGGGSDFLTRLLASNLSKNLGQTVLVKNVSGAGGTIGSAEVARANPDGYTLLNHHIGMATAPALYTNLPFDTLKAFEPIGLWADTPMVVLSGTHLPPASFEQLVAHIKEKKGNITFASSGMGSATHLCALQFERVIGTKLTMVQYKGGPPAHLDILGGRVDLICDVTASNVVGQVQAGKLKAFVLAGDKRLKSLPNVPTSVEAGIPELNVSAWYGLYGPAGIPESVVGRLSKALQVATRDPALAAELAKMETTLFAPDMATPKALRNKLSSEIEFWLPLIRKASAASK